MTGRDQAYAELLLAWARTIDKRPVSDSRRLLEAITEPKGPKS